MHAATEPAAGSWRGRRPPLSRRSCCPFILPRHARELGLSPGCAVEVALGQPRRRGCGAVPRLRPGSGVDCWVDELAFAGATRPPHWPGDAWMVTSVRET